MSAKILIKPLVTEKLTTQMEQGHFAFQVEQTANKIEIRKAIEARYPGIQVKEVRTMIVRGKRRAQQTRKGRVTGRVASYKKAIVTLLPESKRIDFFEEV